MGNGDEENLGRLLRLKGCERPGGDFWNSFDGKFQARRLALLVRRPFWMRLIGKLRRIFRPSVATLGIGGVVCVLLFSWPKNFPGNTVTGTRELLMVALASNVDDGVFIEEDFGDAGGDFCYVSELLPSGDHGPLLVACNF
ncbi:MAG: hypothetical protein LBS68_01075 [Puniceicoccales bacterium]|jgi:hypothetical protein|nr:hypothetical protein [Puniceicoccales bacterium]